MLTEERDEEDNEHDLHARHRLLLPWLVLVCPQLHSEDALEL